MKKLRRLGLVLVVATAFAASVSRSMWGQTPPSGRTLRVNDIEMFVQVRGAGEPLVLLHGFFTCGGTWGPVADLLAKQYQLLIPDLRTHGRSTNPAGTFTHRQAALDVYALLDQLGVKRFKAMGISTGGMTLLHMATQQPDRIDAMVLIGATSYFAEPARAFMRQVSPDSISAQERQEFAACAVRDDAQIRALKTQFRRIKDSYDDMNFTPPLLGSIKARTLIVHGDRDGLVPIDIPVEMYRAIPGAALWIVPTGGHIPIFGRHLREFQDVSLAFLQNAQDMR
jgi:pimeloyl-ACP methyl ester carboxylesterase